MTYLSNGGKLNFNLNRYAFSFFDFLPLIRFIALLFSLFKDDLVALLRRSANH